MDSTMVSRLLERVPERTRRASSGTPFLPSAAACEPAGRMALVARFLSWLSPLSALTKDEQRELGLGASGGRAADADGEPAEAEDPLGEEEPIA